MSGPGASPRHGGSVGVPGARYGALSAAAEAVGYARGAGGSAVRAREGGTRLTPGSGGGVHRGARTLHSDLTPLLGRLPG